MKFRKFLIICAIMAVMMTLFAISVSAVDFVVSMDLIESIEKTVSGYDCWGNDENMFDGITDSAGGWYTGNGFALPKGESATINFIEEFEIKSVIFYGWSNWSSYSVTFYDAQGNETHCYESGGWQDTNGAAHDLEISGIKAKSMVIKTIDSKGLRNHTYTEFVINVEHEHKYTIYDEIVVAPTCAKEGQARYFCSCGDEALFPVTPHGQHIERELVVYRNGFTNPGYKATVCMNCDTMDKDITEEIGPLFTSLGYSVREDGTGGIQLGFGVNRENVAYFKELSGIELQFGTVTGSRAVLNEGNPLQLSGNGVEAVNDSIVLKEYTSLGYDLISCSLSGFGEALFDTQLILSAYIYDGYNIYYLGADTTLDVVTQSYNDVRGYSSKE